MPKDKNEELGQAAPEYRDHPTPCRIANSATKQPINQRDMALAYSPDAAAACASA